MTDLAAAARALDGAPALEVLRWAAATYPRVALATSLGPEDGVLLDLIARHDLPIEVFTLDTGLLFDETRALWRALEARYQRSIRAVAPAQTVAAQAAEVGDALWARAPDACCARRKLAPLAAELARHDAWITAIRRDQTADRADAAVVEADRRFGLVKVNPLVAWTSAQVWQHLADHDVPTNPLHGRGYPSIGCAPCTSPVAAGEDPRSGRWRGRAKDECGLHQREAPPSGAAGRRLPVVDGVAAAGLRRPS
ncbi:MAG: phosphoadenylyl-sulfate reductase [Myxococcales bacterium]|nr:phosphoadenylyl-sulfate reductase [Myxococcales bacterium]MBK7196418.1 phosphoadenylyl-sulfate reductase [Myxococcales bacterium]MBP6842619.1 phosphoadenylyl-sulfate reductase [Kofleriaceae bacterium]